MSLKQKIITGALWAGAGLLSTGIIAGIIENGKYERSRRAVQMLIDRDHNRVITPEEWKPVYDFFGIKPRSNCIAYGYGLEFNREQLDQYLQVNQIIKHTGGKIK